jgi:hypothetical protein
MSLIINKVGKDINGNEFPFLKVDIYPELEPQYNRVSIKTSCFNGIDISIGVENPLVITPEKWDRFNVFTIEYEDEIQDLTIWSHEKTIEELSSEKNIPYEYMMYEDDIYDLDPITGEQILDPVTSKPIKLHKKGELIKKSNGTYFLYTRVLPRYCESEDVIIT